MGSDQSLEIEVKFLVPSLKDMRERLLGAGAKILKPRTHENNIRYDTPWQGLMLQGKLLRLRQDDEARLTYKGDPSGEIDSEARVREELELAVTDFETMDAILQRVGFQPQQRYEKFRETFVLDKVEVVLDEMPFGEFIELEGDEGAIREAAMRLGLDWDKRILANYLALMVRLKEYHDMPFDDLTFENFTDLKASAADILPYGC